MVFRCADRQLAAIWHRVAGIDRQIEQRHFDLVRIGMRAGQQGVDVNRQPDARPACGCQQPCQIAHQHAQIDGGRLQWLAPRKRQQALHQRSRTFGRLDRAIDQAAFAIAADTAALQNVETAHDRCQQVVEIVRHTAGKLAHRFKLLRLAKRSLGLFQARSSAR